MAQLGSTKIFGDLTITGQTNTNSISTTGVIKSLVATGTAPLAIESTTAVTNLNADMLDGLHLSQIVTTAAVNAAAATTVGTITSGVWNGAAVPIANGGTGATTAAAALTNLGAAASSHTHSYLPLSGGTISGTLLINNSSPTISLVDTDHRSAHIHVNSNLFYVLRGAGTNSTTWESYNGQWPFIINLETNDITGGGNITAYSDVRLKTNIITVDNPIEKVKSLRGVYYNRKENPNSDRKIGVVAQEVINILPEVVIEHGEDKILSVDYGNMVGLLIEAIKEQQTQIEELKALVGK